MKTTLPDTSDLFIAAINLIIAILLFTHLSAAISDTNANSVPARLLPLLAYFSLGIVSSLVCIAGSVKLIRLSKNMRFLLALTSAFILVASGFFAASIIPYD